MFEKFDNLPPNYQPDNMHPKRIPFDMVLENENVKKLFRNGEFIGYKWNYGENVFFDITVNKHIKVATDSIITHVHGEKPSTATAGLKNYQRYYNLTDVRSWLYAGKDADGKNMWVEDDYLTFSSADILPVEVTPLVIGKTLKISIYDFRYEEVFKEEVGGVSNYRLTIDSETSKKLLRGVYIMEVRLYSETENTLVNKFELHVV